MGLKQASAPSPVEEPSAPSPTSPSLTQEPSAPSPTANDLVVNAATAVDIQPGQHKEEDQDQLEVEFLAHARHRTAVRIGCGVVVCIVAAIVPLLIHLFLHGVQGIEDSSVYSAACVVVVLVVMLMVFRGTGQQKCCITSTHVISTQIGCCSRVEKSIPLHEVRRVTISNGGFHTAARILTITTGTRRRDQVHLRLVANAEQVRMFIFDKQAQLRRELEYDQHMTMDEASIPVAQLVEEVALLPPPPLPPPPSTAVAGQELIQQQASLQPLEKLDVGSQQDVTCGHPRESCSSLISPTPTPKADYSKYG